MKTLFWSKFWKTLAETFNDILNDCGVTLGVIRTNQSLEKCLIGYVNGEWCVSFDISDKNMILLQNDDVYLGRVIVLD